MEISGAFLSANKHILAGPAIMRYSQGLQVEIDPGTGGSRAIRQEQLQMLWIAVCRGVWFYP